MAATTRKSLIPPADIPAERLFRMEGDQFRRAVEAGAIPVADGVVLAKGLLHTRGNGGPLYRMDLDQYHRLVDNGILDERHQTELLGGWIVAKMPINPPHQTATRKTRAELSRRVPRGWFVDQNAPISLPFSDSEPEPDVVVIRGDLRDFAERHPGSGDTALVIEVAHSSLAEDRGFQKRLYAVEGIPVYWIVNLVDLQIEVCTEPSGPSEAPDYQTRRDYKPGDSVPLVIEDQQRGLIPVAGLLP